VAALQRALALADVDDVAVLIADDLHLDVARRLDEFFGVHRTVAEERLGLARDALVCGEEIFRAIDAAQALAATTGAA
jgi:hypothetical protein